MKNSKRIRNGLFVLFIIALGFVGYKFQQGYEKKADYQRAAKYYQQHQYAKSEQYYKKVISNRSIQYKDTQSRIAYDRLAAQKEIIFSYLNNAESAYENKNFKALADTYKDYLKTKESKKNDMMFIDFDKHLKAAHQFSALFSEIKKDSYKQMDDNMRDEIYKNEDFFKYLAALPPQVYGNDNKKNKELVSRFKKYDEAKYSSLEKSLSFGELKTNLENQMAIYKEIGFKALWLKETLAGVQTKQEQKIASIEKERQKREEELQKAQDAEKAKDPNLQEEIMTAVNDYAKGWMDAYNYLDSSYFVNITPELKSFFEKRFQKITANNGAFTGELLHTEFDLDSFKYSQDDNAEYIELDVILSMNSASYEAGEDYVMEETSNPWHYRLINSGDGWKLSERKELNDFNHNNSRVFDFGSSY